MDGIWQPIVSLIMRRLLVIGSYRIKVLDIFLNWLRKLPSNTLLMVVVNGDGIWQPIGSLIIIPVFTGDWKLLDQGAQVRHVF